jgi:hypothetical protein
MPHYLLSVYQPDGPVPEPEVLAAIGQDLDALNAELRAAGAFVYAGGLLPPDTAAVIRRDGDDVTAREGPFAAGEHHLGGFTIVDVPDREAALEWGRRLAVATTLPIEVRPFAG